MTTLGKYELHEQLGKGGFGTVFRATDSIGRTVAIKVLKPGFADDPNATDRFRREALAAGSLYHPQIATIIDFGEDAGRLYLVMRYIDGKSLDQLIKEQGTLPWRQALQYLEDIGSALEFAHRKGFIHRDIKPGNILISPTEGAVLTDFGLVKAATSSGMSTTGVMLGTPAYIAPEIWMGKGATPATDEYSLACVFYEMISGNVLFDGESTPEIMKKIFDPIQLPEQWPEGVPAGIAEVLKTALLSDPTQRYVSVALFVESVGNLADKNKQLNPPSIDSLVHSEKDESTENLMNLQDQHNTPPVIHFDNPPPPLQKTGLEPETAPNLQSGYPIPPRQPNFTQTSGPIPTRKGLGNWSLILSLIAGLGLAISFLISSGNSARVSFRIYSIMFSIIGIILGIVYSRYSKKTPSIVYESRGKATAGIVIGTIVFLLICFIH